MRGQILIRARHCRASATRGGAETGQLSLTARNKGPALAQTGHPLAGALLNATSHLPTIDTAAATDIFSQFDAEQLSKAAQCDQTKADTLNTTPLVQRWPDAFPGIICDYPALARCPC